MELSAPMHAEIRRLINQWRAIGNRTYTRTLRAVLLQHADELEAALLAASPAPATLESRLESQEFYDLMQRYRHTPTTAQGQLVYAFEDVKRFIAASPHCNQCGRPYPCQAQS